MATPKTITAYDIEQGKLTISRDGPTVNLERRYSFVDDVGDIIPNLAGGRLIEEIAIGSIPPAVTAALLTIDNWTYAQSLAQEGMT